MALYHFVCDNNKICTKNNRSAVILHLLFSGRMISWKKLSIFIQEAFRFKCPWLIPDFRVMTQVPYIWPNLQTSKWFVEKHWILFFYTQYRKIQHSVDIIFIPNESYIYYLNYLILNSSNTSSKGLLRNIKYNNVTQVIQNACYLMLNIRVLYLPCQKILLMWILCSTWLLAMFWYIPGKYAVCVFLKMTSSVTFPYIMQRAKVSVIAFSVKDIPQSKYVFVVTCL